MKIIEKFTTIFKSLRLITIAAFIFRLYGLSTYTQQYPKNALGAIPFLFEPGNIAWAIYTGDGFASPFRIPTGPTAWMTPVYPEILAGIFHRFGAYTFDAFLAAALFNILCSTLATIPLYYAARRFNCAATAAWLWAIFPNAILLTYQALWDASIGALLAALILAATLALKHSTKLRDWLIYGALWGFTLMTTAALGALLPFLLLWAAISKPRKLPAAALIVAVLACVPWTVRNYQVFHTLVPLRTVMGLSMWLGNNEKADGISTANLHPIANSTERDLYIQQGEIAYNANKQKLALEFMAAHPAKTLLFSYRRFIAIWSGGTAHPLADFLHNKDKWFRYVLLFNLAAAIFAPISLILLWRRKNPMWVPLAVFPAIFPLAYYVTLAPPRYRHPIDPALMLLTAIALQAICQNIYRRFGASSPVQHLEKQPENP